MDIKEFVSSTIVQVFEAVSEAQVRARELGGYVNPTVQSLNRDAHYVGLTATGQAVFSIEFDVALTVSESASKGGKTVQIASLSTTDGDTQSAKHERISRVKFTVPLTLPVDTDSSDERDQRRALENAAIQRATEARRRRNAQY